jgi:hypothetical protein
VPGFQRTAPHKLRSTSEQPYFKFTHENPLSHALPRDMVVRCSPRHMGLHPVNSPSPPSIRGRSSLQPMAYKQLQTYHKHLPLTSGSPWPSLPAPQPGYTCSSITVSWDGVQIKYSPTSTLQTGSKMNRLARLVGSGQLLNISFEPLYQSDQPQHKAAQYIEEVCAPCVRLIVLS